MRRLKRNIDGNVAIVFALSLPLVIGGAGLAVETSYWYYELQKLQSVADASAFAGAIERRAGSDHATVQTAATAVAVQNGFDPSAGEIVVNSPPLTGVAAGGQAVEVILTQWLPRFFTRIYSDTLVEERARAVARFQATGNACILALNSSASRAALFSGNVNFTLAGCNVMANSIAADAVTAQGSSTVNVDCIVSGGGASLTRNVVQTAAGCPVLHAPPVGDPFADLPVPVNTDPSQTTNNSNYAAGKFVYTGGLTLRNAVDMQPGTYIISGGNFSVNANANVTCSACVNGAGVTIYLTGGARVSMNGNATVNLTAPTTGTYAGMLFFGDRNSSGGSTNRFNGTASSQLTGNIYFKSQAVEYLGNFSGRDGCTKIVGDTVAWSGNTTINQDCTAYGMREIPTSQLVRLVE